MNGNIHVRIVNFFCEKEMNFTSKIYFQFQALFSRYFAPATHQKTKKKQDLKKCKKNKIKKNNY